jgi:hypothetical protein
VKFLLAILLLLCLCSCKSLTYEQGYLNGNIKYPQSASAN